MHDRQIQVPLDGLVVSISFKNEKVVEIRRAPVARLPTRRDAQGCPTTAAAEAASRAASVQDDWQSRPRWPFRRSCARSKKEA
jgi:hypothetical protein